MIILYNLSMKCKIWFCNVGTVWFRSKPKLSDAIFRKNRILARGWERKICTMWSATEPKVTLTHRHSGTRIPCKRTGISLSRNHISLPETRLTEFYSTTIGTPVILTLKTDRWLHCCPQRHHVLAHAHNWVKIATELNLGHRRSP